MSYTPVEVPQFTGLNLIEDPQEVTITAAVDCANVDLAAPGRLRTRNGYTTFATASGSATPVFNQTRGILFDDGTAQLLVGRDLSASTWQLEAYDTAGTRLATDNTLTAGGPFDFQPFGTTSSEYVFCANGGDTLRRWDGSAFATPVYTGVANPNYRFLERTSNSNRLVMARGAGSAASNVRFSQPDDPLTWNTDDFVPLNAGDGEDITGMASFDSQIFVFKQSRFYVFGAETVDSTGGTIFNYRTVEGTGCAAIGGVCSTEHGIYFFNQRGLYVTTGGPAQLVSRLVTPIFYGDVPALFTGEPFNRELVSGRNWPNFVSMSYHLGRLYFSYAGGSNTTPSSTLVYDPILDAWAYWDVGGYLTSFFRRDDSDPSLMCANGATLSYSDDSTSTDGGGAIAWHYQSGFYDLGSPSEKVIRESALWGTGTVTLQVAVNQGTVDTGSALTLGVDPAVTRAKQRIARRGRLFSHKLSGSGDATVHSLCHFARDARDQ